MFHAFTLLIIYHTLETVHTNECLRLRAAGLNSQLIDIFIPKCEQDGTYTPVQCHTNGCYCADEFGAPITDVDISLEEVKRTNMNCRCARDRLKYMKTIKEKPEEQNERIFLCERNGNYAKVQCTGSICYCVDDEGNQRTSSTVHISRSGSVKC
ncbi:nidogen-2-like [Argonauta hians]